MGAYEAGDATPPARILIGNPNMKNAVLFLTAASLLAAAPMGAAHAQTKKKPAGKPAKAAPAKKPGGPIVLGTTQLPGDFGKIGQTYTIGKDYPINFTLDSVRYTADRYTVHNNTYVPKDGEKLMVLRYTIHNPLPKEQRYYWADLKFTAVDALDTNHEYITAVRRAGIKEESFNQSLKPAQKVQIEAAILVPANGEVPKLIVERERNAPVIRYDLRGKVAKLGEPYADPADASGATLRKDIPFKFGDTAPLGGFDVKLESVAYTDEALGGREIKPGYRNATAVFTFKNMTASKLRYYWGDFEVVGRDADGEKVPYTQAMLKASRNEKTDGQTEPGEEVRVRFYFPVPEKVDAKSISLREMQFAGSKGRWITFDLAGAAAQTASSGQ
jgi:hypothetical protein